MRNKGKGRRRGGKEEKEGEGRSITPCYRPWGRLHWRHLSRSLEGNVGGAGPEQGPLERWERDSWALAALLPHRLQSPGPQRHRHPLSCREVTLKTEGQCVH